MAPHNPHTLTSIDHMVGMRQVTIGQDKSDWIAICDWIRWMRQVTIGQDKSDWMGGVCPCLQKFPQTDFVRGNGEKRLSGDGAGYT